MRLVGATNLTEPSASIFATFSFRGTELAKSDIVKPTQPKFSTDEDIDESETGGASKDRDGYSHVWLAQHSSSTCTVPLPEECMDRRETEIEIDLWEEGGPEKEHGDHLGQVDYRYRTAGCFYHGEYVSNPGQPKCQLRAPPRRRTTPNVAESV